MSPSTLAIVCTNAPLLGFLAALILLRGRHAAAAGATIVTGGVSLITSLLLLRTGPGPHVLSTSWFQIGGQDLRFGFLLDGPNLLMGFIVAFISLSIQIYSVGYMAGDRGKDRYFAFLGFFEWSMLSFVYASSLLQMFIFWELVGLASFLLIGFWYEKPAAAAAGRKAFVMTRVGDVGLYIGLILLFQLTGTLEIAHLNQPETIARLTGGQITWIGLLLFCGVAGKSAQFPLHTWLPDAMEGPTPVSALLHSATMVAAGVFLFARFEPLFLAGTTVPLVVLSIAGFTALLSATIAIVSMDIKRVLAYSSISQLSFMLLGLAAGSVYAGLYHLFTHALFKALLFLCAGAYIHHIGSNDLVTIGRAGGRSLRWTTVGLVVGAAALAGLPPLAGFFSKEAIFSAVGGTGPLFAVIAFAAAFLTAYYTFRMVFLVLRPNPDGKLQPEEPIPAGGPLGSGPGAGHTAGHAAAHAAAQTGGHTAGHAAAHGADAPWVMRGPILALTLGTAIAGLAAAWVASWTGGEHGGAHGAHLSWAQVMPALLVTLAGVVAAWFDFGRRGASQLGFASRLGPIHRLFVRKWYVDEFYGAVIAAALRGVSRTCAFFEVRGLDRTADGVATGTRQGGSWLSRYQSGRLQLYIGTAVLLVAVFCYLIGS